jgi:hypothetical protein
LSTKNIYKNKIYLSSKDMPGIRAKENRTITISLPKTLVEDIDRLAKADDRSRSKWIVRELQKAVEYHRSDRALRVANKPHRWGGGGRKRIPAHL